MFTSLRARLWLSYALLILTALGIVAVVLVLFLLRNPLLYRQTLVRIKAAESVLGTGTQTSAGMREVAQAFSVRAMVFDRAGTLIEDTSDAQARLALPAHFLNSRPSGTQRDSSGKVWFYSAQELPNGNWLLIAAPRPKVIPVLAVLTDELSLPFLEGGVIALLLALLLALLVSRWIADPLERLISAARTTAPDRLKPVLEDGPHEIRELTKAFNALMARVQASQKAQHDFVANVSHELKTPLTSIQGFAQALMDGTVDEPQARKQAAEVIYNEAGRMHRMALDLLDLAKFDIGSANLRIAAVDVGSLLEAVGDKFRPVASACGVQLHVSVPAGLPPLAGDGDRLAQVFGNLVDNALKFTPSGGSVAVRALAGKNEIQVSVNDTGKGISPEAIPHIFDRFYQADPARSGGDGHGAGLGLAIVREIVAAHGGRISVRSAEGRGTGFVVHLPLVHFY